MGLTRRQWLKTVAAAAAVTAADAALSSCRRFSGDDAEESAVTTAGTPREWPDGDAIIARLPREPIDCVECGACMPCAYGVNIPASFILYNQALEDGAIPPDGSSLADSGRLEAAAAYLRRNEQSIGDIHMAHRCVACCHCLSECPKHLPIVGYLNSIGRFFDLIRERLCQ